MNYQFQDVESGNEGSASLRSSSGFRPSLSEIKRNNVEANGCGAGAVHLEARDTVVTTTVNGSASAGNGAVCVQPVKNSSSNPFVDPSKRHSSVDMKGKNP